LAASLEFQATRPSRMFLSIASISIVLIGAPRVTSAQWLHYPTPDVPRTADGKPNLTAPPPRLPEGRPDFSGIWQSAVKIPCAPEFSRFVACGLEISGSPPELRHAGDSDHRRRLESVHASMDSRDEPEDHARYRTDRRGVPREREVVAADAGITMRPALLIRPVVRET
jgi:hypothetical protein